MPHRAVPRAFGDPVRDEAVGHDRLTGWTGHVEIAWTFERERPVVIGAGWFRVEEPEAAAPRRSAVGGVARRRPSASTAAQADQPVVVAEIVRRGAERLPVLPGSSLKGAVRQVYELLTPSCIPGSRDACRVRPKEPKPQLCPACGLFGAPGFGGRLAFGEAAPAGADAARRVRLVEVPTAWAPRRPVLGAVRVYGQGRAVGQDGAPAPAREQTWGAWGEFRSRLRLVNAEDDDLGVLFAALGLGADGPGIRLGGKKFHGFGAAHVAIIAADRAYPEAERVHLDADGAAAWVAGLAARALADPRRRETWDALHEALRAGD